ncbi:catechol 2,3-dioxygenase [Sphaerotilus uruguayifluvii]|uniref:Metapyrocatechase n=1 Tax=Sphaerotilus uruguayifluvii TaxID=2735897 RepID=A0ABX2G057_9BURK|nr:catechol 2,3-dioxygenase [Leptothrix sp. C29]NRT54833.1 catechol 2,3-dioxygenase [Leptothrix sp. C29]GIX53914.1 catechol 2,3-dioxygenase [Sphaerotilus natans]
MALTGVLRPGHVQLRMLDLEEGVRFYRDVLGLEETGRDAAGRVYLKAWDERDHHSIVLRQADRAGLDFFGFKVAGSADLDRFEAELRDDGLKTERIPAGELLETGERLRFELPSGHLIELYAEKTFVGSHFGQKDPKPWTPHQDRGIAPMRFDHALLYGPNVDRVLDIFTRILGFHLAEYVTLPDSDVKGALWLCCSNKAHDIAFVIHPEPGKLHHVSFYMESIDRVFRAADIMAAHDIKVDIGPTRHGITRGGTIYAWDPSGNRFETFSGGNSSYPDLPPIAWTWEGLGEGGGLDVAHRKMHETFLTVVT